MVSKEVWVCVIDAEGRPIKRDMDRLCLTYEPQPEGLEVFKKYVLSEPTTTSEKGDGDE